MALDIRLVRLVVRTPGFHPGNRGSIPLRATNFTQRERDYGGKTTI